MSTTDKTHISSKKLKTIMDAHAKYLAGKAGGKRANLKNVVLTGLISNYNFSKAVFENVTANYVTFCDCKFNRCNFDEDCKFISADFNDCDLTNIETENGTIFAGASFDKCDFEDANCYGAIFRDTAFWNTNLTNVRMYEADFTNADFTNCKLDNIKYDECTCGIALACPEKGAFTAYKKAELYNCDRCIVELQVPADALRSSATTRKCRVSKAKVVAVYRMDGKSIKQNAYSSHTRSFVYKIGKMVEVKNFDKNRWDECSTGIHCFITKKEAEHYC